MVRTKILKKRTKTFDRFESDRHVRMGVRNNIKNNLNFIEKLETTKRYRLQSQKKIQRCSKMPKNWLRFKPFNKTYVT